MTGLNVCPSGRGAFGSGLVATVTKTVCINIIITIINNNVVFDVVSIMKFMLKCDTFLSLSYLSNKSGEH